MLHVIGYAIAVAVLLGVAGFAAEHLLARRGLPRRLAWCMAMLGSTVFPLLMMSMAQPAPVATEVIAHVAEPLPPAVAEPGPAESPPVPKSSAFADDAPPAVADPAMERVYPVTNPGRDLTPVAAESATRWTLPKLSDEFILALWLSASSVLLLYVVGTTGLLHFRSRRWQRESILGHEIAVSDDTGPALLGALRPTILMPRWCLDEPAATRTLILQHELEHVSGRDPLLLWAAVLVVVALPWNLPLWWQLRRLRLAMEMDCDARVVRAGADAVSYGEVLLAVTRRAAEIRGVAIAMGRPMSALEQRIRNLAPVAPRHAGLRTASSLLVVLTSAAAAAVLQAPVMPRATLDPGSMAPALPEQPAPLAREGGSAPESSTVPAMTAIAATAAVPDQDGSIETAADLAAAQAPRGADAAVSANPLDCIDDDVLYGLLLGPRAQQLSVSQVAPPELAAFKAPRELQWVAAAERDMANVLGSTTRQTSVAAVYRTNLPPEAARTAVASALAAGGWKLHQDSAVGYGLMIFDTLGTAMSSDTHCREGQPVNVTHGVLDGVTYVSLTVARGPGAFNPCGQPARTARPAGTLDRYLPKLELPQDPVTGQPATLRGMSGAGSCETGCRAYVSFALQDSAANVARFFANQIARQGWSADTSWTGAGTAGSTWLRSTDTDQPVQATLTVSEFEQSRFMATFKVAGQL